MAENRIDGPMEQPKLSSTFLLILCFLAISFPRTDVVGASGTIYIRPDGSIEPTTANIATVDKVIYTFTGNIHDSIVVERDDIVIFGAGCTLQGTGNGTGIELSERRNVTIKNVEIESFEYGIQMDDSSNNTISDNSITDNCYGIELRFCSNNTVSENNVTSYRHAIGYGTTCGILLRETSKTLVSQNNITRNDYGILVLDSSSHNVISENNMTNNTEGIIILSGPSDNAIIGNQIAYSFRSVMLNEPRENNTFSKNTITDSDIAVWALNTSNNTFSGNYMINTNGFYFHQCQCNEFYGNEISGGTGIWLTDNSSHNVIYENNINDSHVQLNDSFSNIIYRNNMTKCGITLVSSSNNSISGNYMSAISVWQSNCNDIFGNSMIGNDQYGIRLSESSGNILRNNKMADNHYNFYIYGETPSDFANDIDTSNTVDGRPIYYWINKRDSTVPSGAGYVALINCTLITVQNQSLVSNGQGVLLINTTDSTVIENNIAYNTYGIYLDHSSSNSIYYNNFANNTVQAYACTFHNFWDAGYPSGGNYWSDYNGTDCDHNGIGDTPYIIDANNTDNYPLMGVFSDFEATLEQHVQTISNPTISDFQLNGAAINFNVSGENGTAGFCRICIPTVLMNYTYTVLVDGSEANSTLLSCSDSSNSYLYFSYKLSTKGTLKDRADLNKDGVVDVLDMIILSTAWNSALGDPEWKPEADLNNDGVINVLDMTLLVSVVGQTTRIATHEVTIIPEFPSLLILPLFMLATLLVATVYKRKHATSLSQSSNF